MYLDFLKKRAKDLGIENQVIFPGFVTDSVVLFNSSDIVMHTSQHESFGKIYVEAMAASKPIVALKGGAAEEVISDGEVGFLFESNELEQMAEKITYLLENDDFRHEIGRKGRERALAHYSMEKHCSKIYNVYSQLIESTIHG